MIRIIHHVINAKLIQEAKNAVYKTHLILDVTHVKLILVEKLVANSIHFTHLVIFV
jgi:hypothetical protein